MDLNPYSLSLFYQDPLAYLASVIQGEASGLDQIAVANVIVNRINAGYRGGDLGAILTTPKQFTGFQTPGANAYAIAQAIINGDTLPNYAGGALEYRGYQGLVPDHGQHHAEAEGCSTPEAALRRQRRM